MPYRYDEDTIGERTADEEQVEGLSKGPFFPSVHHQKADHTQLKSDKAENERHKGKHPRHSGLSHKSQVPSLVCPLRGGSATGTEPGPSGLSRDTFRGRCVELSGLCNSANAALSLFIKAPVSGIRSGPIEKIVDFISRFITSYTQPRYRKRLKPPPSFPPPVYERIVVGLNPKHR